MISEGKCLKQLRSTRTPVSPYKQQLSSTLEDMARAVASSNVAELCRSYLALRSLTRDMPADKRFDLASQALAVAIRPLLAAAYAHRECFMCMDGTLPCEACDASGLGEGGEVCSNCGGDGYAPCEFCRGTNWPDRQTVPRELRLDLLARQLASVRRDVERLQGRRAKFGAVASALMPPGDRKRVLVWLSRLRCRLQDFLDQGVVAEGDRRAMTQQIADIGQCIASLRART